MATSKIVAATESRGSARDIIRWTDGYIYHADLEANDPPGLPVIFSVAAKVVNGRLTYAVTANDPEIVEALLALLIQQNK